jgi:hypothetical protein
MLNMSLLTPRNILVIGLMAILSHVLARPVYRAVDQVEGN